MNLICGPIKIKMINLCFQNVFLSYENEELAFSNASSLKSVFDKLRSRDGLVWTVRQIMMLFQISPV